MAGIDARSITIPDDWWMMRTDALAMVMAAFNTGEEEAARTLAVFCLGHPTEWQYSRQIVTAPSVKVAASCTHGASRPSFQSNSGDRCSPGSAAPREIPRATSGRLLWRGLLSPLP